MKNDLKSLIWTKSNGSSSCNNWKRIIYNSDSMIIKTQNIWSKKPFTSNHMISNSWINNPWLTFFYYTVKRNQTGTFSAIREVDDWDADNIMWNCSICSFEKVTGLVVFSTWDSIATWVCHATSNWYLWCDMVFDNDCTTYFLENLRDGLHHELLNWVFYLWNRWTLQHNTFACFLKFHLSKNFLNFR